MLEMTVIISAFPYTSIKYFTYHLDSFLELQVSQNYLSDIFHIFRNDIFNFELSFTEEIFQKHQLWNFEYFEYFQNEIYHKNCHDHLTSIIAKKLHFYMLNSWFFLYNSIIIVNIYRSNHLNDKTHIFLQTKQKTKQIIKCNVQRDSFVNNVRKLGSGHPFIYKNIIVKLEGIEKWSKYLL